MTVGNVSPTGSSFSENPGSEIKQGGSAFSEVLARRLPQSGSLDDAFLNAGRTYNVSPALLKAVASAESGFNPNVVSSAGAVGLMQIMPDTARQLGVDPSDPVQSIQGAAKYLRTLLDQFNGNVTLAIAAYNAGPGAVTKYNGIPPYKETQDYVAHVSDLIKKYSSNNAGADTVNGAAVTESTSQPAATDLADLLLLWTEVEGMNALSKLSSDDASGTTTTEDPGGGSLDL